MDQSAQTPVNGPVRRKVRITNPVGFHLRPMQAFVLLAAKFQSRIRVQREADPPVDGKSILDLLATAAEKGTEFTVEAEGIDASAAVEALVDLLANIETRVDNENK